MIIGHGAEAILRKQDDKVVKDRVAKSYRLAAIDMMLRKQRTRRETKILEKLQQLNFPAPRVHTSNDTTMQIVMDFIDGPQVKDVLHQNPITLAHEIGHKVGRLHAQNIIHGDLTTSNMIQNNEITFIDFGLSFVSKKDEDKAVDLHVLDRALESKHHDIYKQCITAVLDGYKEGNPNAATVLQRLETVTQRGRNKKK